MMLQAKSRSCATRRRLLIAGFFIAMATALIGQTAQAQFTSGSDGSDGALDYTGQSGTIIFNPDDFVPPLDPDRDNVYHFTTITIPSGVTLRLRAPELNWAPVFWLAAGLVQIDGMLDLSGEDGHGPVQAPSPAIPGPGGYPGGVGAYLGAPSQAGFGPGGGTASFFCLSGSSHCGSHATSCSTGQTTYGNMFLQPLTGGSGGGGCGGVGASGGGGGGGGAILIASTEEIRVSLGGQIVADGGRGGEGVGLSGSLYYGAGGAIRLVSPVVGGGGAVRALGSGSSPGGGYIRIEATEYLNLFIPQGQLNTRVVNLTENTPLLTNQNTPLIRIVSVDGISIPYSPTADFVSPDVVIDSDQDVVFEIEARNIDPGVTVDVYIYPNDFPLIVTTSTALAGTFEFSTATASVTVPPGLCLSTVRAVISP